MVELKSTGDSASADFAMTSAVLSGLWQSDTLVAQQTKHSCPSGNCTWDTFQSLAVCSACIDLTDRLSRNIVSYIPTCDGGGSFNLTVYRLPNGVGLTNLWKGKPPVAWMVGFGTANGSQSISFGSKDTLIWSMTMIRILEPEAKWPSSSVTAAECGLWYCVNSYDSEVKDGNLREVVSSAPSTRSHNSWQWSTHLWESYWNDFNLQENSKGPETLSYGKFSIENVTDLQLGDGFNVSQEAVYGISNFMNTTFTRSPDDDDLTGAENAMNNCFLGNSTSVLVQGINTFFGHDDDHEIHTSTAMPFLYHSQDLNATFATLAKSMTNSIRENSDENLVMTGKAGTLHVVYQVHWEYLILPIFLVFANAVFLVIVIYHTRKSGLAVLCTGAVPTVGLGGSIGPIFNEVRLRSRMEEAAKLQQVRFISVPREKQNSDDVENEPLSPEGENVPLSPQGEDGPSSHGGDDIPPFHGTEDHEMILMGERLENQESMRRRSDEERSIVSPISLDSRGA